ncbi:tRNA (N6-threonylcarbamoyladenosine(37)-N6)-methyltransferase TrmO [Pontibacterium sp.]|uniref:tRNA (N6-threonylcarbamoyladenosine(37)-N6)-methyltransferase TrmO n=1 Tax=Pontibacterium sp. TaxID=2036026 RepID=UPI003517603B
MIDSLNLQPIAVVRSAFKEKFGIPRQPGLANSIISTIELLPEFASAEAVRGLEQASHIWLIFVFSECVDKGWSPLVRPPRLGGNKKLGVFATRSPFRPNPVGLSPVKLEAVRVEGNKVFLDVRGADLLDGTPILDIKPYLPYSDVIEDAEFAVADKIEKLDLPVVFSPEAKTVCELYEQNSGSSLTEQICDILSCDPRPAYKKNDSERVYGVKLHNFDIRWQITNDQIYVESIVSTGT